MINFLEEITIGIAARNEENTIINCLDSIIKSTKKASLSIRFEIIIVLNGCNDDTEKLVNEYAYFQDDKNICFKILKSQEGQIYAHKEVWKSKSNDNFIIFLDADIILNENCIASLINEMEQNKNLEIAWAKCISHKKAKSTIEKIINLPDFYPEMRKEQNYFTGRAFAIRNDRISILDKTFKAKRYIENYLRLKDGPMIDDVFLSKSILYHKGKDVIKQCDLAVVYFNPITNLYDFYLSQRRTAIECIRLDILFPEYQKKTKKYYKLIIPNSLKNKKSYGLLVCWIIYIFLKRISRLFSKLELNFKLLLCSLGFKQKPCNLWPSVLSTKRKFYE
ncbi:hypothetical protein GCM10011531_07100 [Aquaticitalea lipolytica]|uniref:Glycosyltransferase 2-like domain-containing protein n=1 Tax=Aquaticitalea lipolytica TaxID=1247562 RepID=A0A8J2XFN1_9FLAO|nr:glycosyltransferase family 2 protein [Aquaticitalea lipolytica]GFZ79762.1 hypothetical protein GCM10011531_07100 [Aquaticitalea lipolytica]